MGQDARRRWSRTEHYSVGWILAHKRARKARKGRRISASQLGMGPNVERDSPLGSGRSDIRDEGEAIALARDIADAGEREMPGEHALV